MLTGWKLSVIGILVVGITGIVASITGLIEPGRAIALSLYSYSLLGRWSRWNKSRAAERRRGSAIFQIKMHRQQGGSL